VAERGDPQRRGRLTASTHGPRIRAGRQISTLPSARWQDNQHAVSPPGWPKGRIPLEIHLEVLGRGLQHSGLCVDPADDQPIRNGGHLLECGVRSQANEVAGRLGARVSERPLLDIGQQDRGSLLPADLDQPHRGPAPRHDHGTPGGRRTLRTHAEWPARDTNWDFPPQSVRERDVLIVLPVLRPGTSRVMVRVVSPSPVYQAMAL